MQQAIDVAHDFTGLLNKNLLIFFIIKYVNFSMSCR